MVRGVLKTTIGVLALASGLATGGVAAAADGTTQPPSASPSGTITVTGRNQREVELQIRSFVDDITRGSTALQLARFDDPVCPHAAGLPQEQRALVVRRMRTVAAAAGIPVASANCAPNVIVAVVPDKRAFIELLLDREPGFFGDLGGIRIRRIANQPGHSAAWQVNGAPISARGMELFFDIEPERQFFVNRTTEPATRLYEAARPQFASAFVIIEQAALDGLTRTQLADYAAMRAFARINSTTPTDYDPNTILSVIDAPANATVPVTLTQWDIGYLRGLYVGSDNLRIGGQRAAIRRSISRELGLQPE